eukprot:scaffold35950_cov90-Isochrysis_galbana.AAC.2
MPLWGPSPVANCTHRWMGRELAFLVRLRVPSTSGSTAAAAGCTADVSPVCGLTNRGAARAKRAAAALAAASSRGWVISTHGLGSGMRASASSSGIRW